MGSFSAHPRILVGRWCVVALSSDTVRPGTTLIFGKSLATSGN
ncbi:hypothetical protein ACJU26_08565 [Acidithiobacillus sp. M4-SHS-6]